MGLVKLEGHTRELLDKKVSLRSEVEDLFEEAQEERGVSDKTWSDDEDGFGSWSHVVRAIEDNRG